ncbi:MAG: CoA-binding protein [Treponema sp.]|jgi:redox-sensing transcriptional repressor|nr:CoA-binding protein [Treponema sp.]
MMMAIPQSSKERLLQLLRFLEQNKGAPLTSAEAEALTGWSSCTIRKDISYLSDRTPGDTTEDGEVPGQKVGSVAGYVPEHLIPAIRKALGLDRRRRFCVVGLGRLGSAFLNFHSYELDEFELAAGFDTNVNRVEILKSPAPLYPAYKMAEVISRFSVEIAFLCVPEDAAQSVAEKLAAAGIRGILNFAPAALKLPPEIVVRNVYVVDELRALAVRLKSSGDPRPLGTSPLSGGVTGARLTAIAVNSKPVERGSGGP